jgi:spore coat polysaccharide biosynthesis protein SpsF
MMKTAIVIQARVGSSRLAGKVLLPLAGKTLLERMIERVSAIKSECELIVATTTGVEDERIRSLCRRIGIRCYSGNVTDLLDRHFQAAKQIRADVVAKIPSDCPLIDPQVIDRVLNFHSSKEFDFVSNLHPATYPDGNDVEVMPFDVLEEAWKEATLPFELEHTTPFIWERPNRYRIGNVTWETGLDYSMSHRWTIDYPEDYQFIKAIYDELYTVEHPVFSLYEILDLLEAKPNLNSINSKYAGVNWYRHHLKELKTVTSAQTKIIESTL